jgi:hypothetical protein
MEAAFRRCGVLRWTKMGGRKEGGRYGNHGFAVAGRQSRDSFLARARKLRRPAVTGLGVSSRSMKDDRVKKLVNLAVNECRRFSFSPGKSLRFDFPGRIHGEHAFFCEPGKQHPDRRHVLFDRKDASSVGHATWLRKIVSDRPRQMIGRTQNTAFSPGLWIAGNNWLPLRLDPRAPSPGD